MGRFAVGPIKVVDTQTTTEVAEAEGGLFIDDLGNNLTVQLVNTQNLHRSALISGQPRYSVSFRQSNGNARLLQKMYFSYSQQSIVSGNGPTVVYTSQ